MNKFLSFVCAFFLLAFSACSHSTFYAPKHVYPPTDPGSVAVSPQKSITQPHKLIGRVAVILMGDGEEARSELQRMAANLGANAVIDLRIERGTFRTAASGLAVIIHK